MRHVTFDTYVNSINYVVYTLHVIFFWQHQQTLPLGLPQEICPHICTYVLINTNNAHIYTLGLSNITVFVIYHRCRDLIAK